MMDHQSLNPTQTTATATTTISTGSSFQINAAPSFDSALLNKEGVRCLAGGRTHEAVAYFKQALVTMKESLYQIPEHLMLPAISSSCHDKYSWVSIPDDCEDNTSRSYIYGRAAVFVSDQGGAITEQDYPLYSALILFNIALAYHLRSRKNGDIEERALRDAACFYTTSLQIIDSIQPCYFSKSAITAPIQLAALNNLAVVVYDQGSASRAHDILREAYQLLASSSLLGSNRGGNESAFDQSDFDGITLNAVMMKWTFVAPCA